MYLCPCLKHITTYLQCVFFFSGEIRKYNFQNRCLSQIPKSTVEFRVVQIWGNWILNSINLEVLQNAYLWVTVFFHCFFCFLGWGWRLAGWALTGHGSGPWHLQCEWCHRESLHWHRPTTMQRGCLCHFWLVSHLWHDPWYNSKLLRQKRF